jgi:ABC-type dipeptide/oligopeptide/nickel transport system permease subunit
MTGQVTILGTLYSFGIRLRLVGQGLVEFLRELKDHPSAMVGSIIVLTYVLTAFLAPYLAPHDPEIGNPHLSLAPPAWTAKGDPTYLLGTDFQGRDLLSRIIFGSRISLVVGAVSVLLSAVIGTTMGCIAGYYRGRIDTFLSRLADLLLAWPFLIFAIAVMAFLGPGIINLVAALTFKCWVEFFRLSRGETLAEKTKEYVEAAKVAGQSSLVIIGSEIMPNIFHSILVLATLRMGYMIIMEASLSFLGLGVPPHIPSWGSMVSQGRDFMFIAWWIATLPGLAILILVLSINLFGEGLRDILDPRLKVE